MRRLLPLIIVIAAAVALAVAVLKSDSPLAPPSGDSADRESAGDSNLRDPGEINRGPRILVTATGHVVRMGSRHPLAKVKVSIGESEALSEVDGSFSLLQVPAGEVEVSLLAEGLPPHLARLALSETDPDLGEIAIPADTVFTGQVSGPGGAPVPGATVRILERTRMETGNMWRGPKYEQIKLGAAIMDEGEPAPGHLATTDGSGRFRVEGLSPGWYYFDVVAAGFAHSAEADVEIPEAGTVERTVVLSDGGVIRGKVLDARRAGVGSARIMALPWNEAAEVPYTPILGASSGPDGSFALTGLSLGEEYLILARAPDGRIGLAIRIKAPVEDVELRVGPRFTLQGTVVDDETGAAIPGAALFALLGSSETDQNGSYVLKGVIRSPLLRIVWISAEGYVDKQHQFDLVGSLLGRPVITEDFRLTKIRPGTLRVTARDLDGNVLSGVALVVTEWGDERPMGRGVTRASGEAVLSGVPPSARALKAMKPGYVMVEFYKRGAGERFGAPSESVWVQVIPGGESLAEVTLAKTAEVKGRVTDQAGKPLPGVLVYANSGVSFATTNDDGRFTSNRLPAGVRVRLKFNKQDYLEVIASAEPGSGEEVEVTMAMGGSLTGRVLDQDGKPLPGVQVIARTGEDTDANVRTTAGNAGQFTIPGLPSGRYVLLAQRDGFAPQKSASIDLRLGESRDGFEIVLTKGIKVTVVAVLEDGTEVPAAAVVYGPLERPAEERLVFRQANQGENQMEFRLLPGRYRIVATPLSMESGAGAVEQEVRLDQAGPVQLVLTTEGLGIVIKAKLHPGRELYGMRLKRTEPAQPMITFWFQAEEDGVLRSPPLPPGVYAVMVYARTEDGNWETHGLENLEPSDRPVVVDLTK